MSWADLAATLSAAPDLAGAACTGRPDLFDPAPTDHPDRAHREERALALCASCPVLEACRTYLADLPLRDRPIGVIAGVVRQPPKRGRPPRLDPAV